MDDALVKPQRVRRVAKIKAAPAGAAEDLTALGTLVEIADPKALRPRDFRTDFVYRPQSSAEDLALCELPPLLDSVLAGTDATIIICGPRDGCQAELLDGPGGLCARAAGQVAMELQTRQARHRTKGSGGYSYYLKLRVYQLVGDRIEDLMTDTPVAARLTDTPRGVVVDGLKSVCITSAEEVVKMLEMSRRRQAIDVRPRASTVVDVEVTQADYFAGWGLYGRLTLLETASMDCFAEDRGLVQLREGFDTFRGVYHLRHLVGTWQAMQPGEVNGAALTWVLREVLCGGSVAATVVMCLRQQQPAVSLALMEFLDRFGKVETNPVCCDHKVAGLLRSLRAELLQMKQNSTTGNAGTLDRENADDARRIIIELETKLKGAERQRDDAERMEAMKKSQAFDFHDKYVSVLSGQELLQNRFIITEEEHIKASEKVVEMEVQSVGVNDEMREVRYKDSVLIALLEQQVAEAHLSEKQARDVFDRIEATVEADAKHGKSQESMFEAFAQEAESSKAEAAAHEGSAQGSTAALVQERERSEILRLKLDSAVESKVAKEIELGSLQNKLDSLRVELHEGALNASRMQQEECQRERKNNEAFLEGPLKELQSLRIRSSELLEENRLEAMTLAQERKVGNEDREELLKTRADFQRALARLAVPREYDASNGASVENSDVNPLAIEGLEAMAKDGLVRERKLQKENARLQAHVAELEKQLAWSSRIALEWAPVHGVEAHKVRLQQIADLAAEEAVTATLALVTQGREAKRIGHEARVELEAERQKFSFARAEYAQDIHRRQVAHKLLEAEIGELRNASVAATATDDVANIHQKLLSEVQVLRDCPKDEVLKNLQEENAALKAKLEKVGKIFPAEEKVGAQRLAFLERANRDLEAERSNFLVRSTVAEEQLLQLQKHLKELTEGYQMQILQLKLQSKPKCTPPKRCDDS